MCIRPYVLEHCKSSTNIPKLHCIQNKLVRPYNFEVNRRKSQEIVGNRRKSQEITSQGDVHQINGDYSEILALFGDFCGI